MFSERLREYFTFTRKERIGVLVLIFLIIIIFILPVFFSSPSGIMDQQELNQLKKEIVALETGDGDDSSSSGNFYEKRHDNNNSVDRESKQEKENIHQGLFFFDPNSISEDQWRKLGLRDKTIHTIEHYLSKGGRFKNAEDLKKIYGMNEGDCRRLIPYVRIEAPDRMADTVKSSEISFKTNYHPYQKDSNSNSAIARKIDINTADSSEFIQLKGIGSKLANRIIRFRDRLGGFNSVDQVGETFGLPDSVFQKIKTSFVIIGDSVRKIDINLADVNTLQQHPYIGWTIAKGIVQYRTQHGLFKSLEELQQIFVIDPEKLRKMVPYLKISDSHLPANP